jgi:hypothetical protein
MRGRLFHVGRMILLCALLILSSAAEVQGGSAPTSSWLFWRQLNNEPFVVSSVAYDPGVDGTMLALAIANGVTEVIRSNDDGITWGEAPIWTAPASVMPYQLTAGHASGIIYAWSGTNLYRTTNSGADWTITGYGFPCNVIDRFFPHPSDPNILYVGSRSGFVRSLDGGQTWEGDYAQGGCITLAIREVSSIGAGVNLPNVVYVGIPYSAGGGVFRSADNGTNWDYVSNGLPLTAGANPIETIIDLAVDPRDANHVFALSEGGQVFETVNGGILWEARGSGLTEPIRSIELDTQRSYALYGLSETRLHQLADATTTWSLAQVRPFGADPDDLSLSILSIRLDPTGTQNFAISDGFMRFWYTVPEVGVAHLPLTIR